jgi:flagellar biosynthesis component FlhA
MRSFLPRVPKWIDDPVRALNKSKLFAGFIIIVLNISSKFVTIKLSKSMEAYLRHTFSRDVLIFAMAWMGTREIYTALVITSMFMLCSNYLFNEESCFCCLPEGFTQYHLSLEEEKEKEKEKEKEQEQGKKEKEQEQGKQEQDKEMLPRT